SIGARLVFAESPCISVISPHLRLSSLKFRENPVEIARNSPKFPPKLPKSPQIHAKSLETLPNSREIARNLSNFLQISLKSPCWLLLRQRSGILCGNFDPLLELCLGLDARRRYQNPPLHRPSSDVEGSRAGPLE